MPLMTSIVDIGLAWPAGETRNVEAGRAALLVNAGWAKPAKSPTKPRRTKKTKSAKPATTQKEEQ